MSLVSAWAQYENALGRSLDKAVWCERLPLLKTGGMVEDGPHFSKVLEISPFTVSSKYFRVPAAIEVICHKGQDVLTTALGNEV